MKQYNVSVVIPVYNAEKEIENCLNAVCNSKYVASEVIVVDDCSLDSSALIASKFNCRVIKNEVNKGPSESRNIGAFAAKGELILFLDSDIIVEEDTLTKIVSSFNQYPDIVGVWGVISKRHPNNNYYSQYKNLFLHFCSLKFEKFSSHLVSAVAAIKKNIFIEFGGFDTKFKTVCIEDVDLGYRLGSRGFKIYLNRDIQVVHTKYYSFKKLVKNDYHKNKIYTMFLLKNLFNKKGESLFAKDKGVFQRDFIISSIPLYLSVCSLLLIPFYQLIIYSTFVLFAVFIILNKEFLHFLFKEKGLLFTLKSIPMIIVERLVVALAFSSGSKEFIFKVFKNESNQDRFQVNF